MRQPFSLSILIAVLSLSLDIIGCAAHAQPVGASDDLVELGSTTDSTDQKSEASSPTPTKGMSQSTGQLKVTKVPLKESEEGSDLYLRQIQRIESQVNELKEEIFRSRTRLAILKESVLASGLSGTQVRVIHRNEMGANFKLERALYKLDDNVIGRLGESDDSKEEIIIYDYTTFNENKQLSVEMVFRGHGFGVFSYLQTFQFTVSDAMIFKPEDGKRVVLIATAYERGGISVKTEDRPALRIGTYTEDLDKESGNSKKSVNTKTSDKANTSAP